MLGLKLNHVSKRGHWRDNPIYVYVPIRFAIIGLPYRSLVIKWTSADLMLIGQSNIWIKMQNTIFKQVNQFENVVHFVSVSMCHPVSM